MRKEIREFFDRWDYDTFMVHLESGAMGRCDEYEFKEINLRIVFTCDKLENVGVMIVYDNLEQCAFSIYTYKQLQEYIERN